MADTDVALRMPRGPIVRRKGTLRSVKSRTRRPVIIPEKVPEPAPASAYAESLFDSAVAAKEVVFTKDDIYAGLCSGCKATCLEVAGGCIEVHDKDCPEFAKITAGLAPLPWAGE